MPTPAKSLAELPVDDRRPDAEVPLAVAAGVDPADRAGVAVPVELLELGQVLERQVDGSPRDRRGGMQQPDEIEGARVARRRGLARVPVIEVPRWLTLRSSRIDRPSGTSRCSDDRRERRGDRVDDGSVLGALLRRCEQRRLRPAVGCRGPRCGPRCRRGAAEAIRAPLRRMRSSGVAPMKPSMAKSCRRGEGLAGARGDRPDGRGRLACTVTSRASTTLSRRPLGSRPAPPPLGPRSPGGVERRRA